MEGDRTSQASVGYRVLSAGQEGGRATQVRVSEELEALHIEPQVRSESAAASASQGLAELAQAVIQGAPGHRENFASAVLAFDFSALLQQEILFRCETAPFPVGQHGAAASAFPQPEQLAPQGSVRSPATSVRPQRPGWRRLPNLMIAKETFGDHGV